MARPDEASASSVTTTKGRLRGWPAIRAHITLVVGLTLSIVAFVFELFRARQGNELSWAYVIEWPLLATFGLYLWWHVVTGRTLTLGRGSEPPRVAPEHEAMLAAWQQHQRTLAEGAGTEAGPTQ
jgi:hypothetical protein